MWHYIGAAECPYLQLPRCRGSSTRYWHKKSRGRLTWPWLLMSQLRTCHINSPFPLAVTCGVKFSEAAVPVHLSGCVQKMNICLQLQFSND
ncbi:similar to bA90M5.1 (novel protein) [Homo sapiens]|nr:similar to bA90M5.1 (novel protein) [Homo sapiens]